jgi:CubicO group peptidase (beta-lactamase class C family)
LRPISLSLLAFALAAAPLAAQDTAPNTARMEQVAAAQAESGEFMGAALVARDGTIVFDKGYGSANLEWQIPNDGDTKFRLGSVTKQFTAVAIMLLRERGKVDLQAPVKTYLPDAPAAWDEVTVFNLLTHSSGIPNFTSFEDYGKTKTLPTNVDELIARFRDKPLDFAPGEQFSYSNSGYILLTAIVEKASGQSYADFVHENLFEPLGMADSGYDSHAAIVPRRASGYAPTPNGPMHADYLDMTIPQGAGALYSTTHDLLKWENGLFGGKVLEPESLDLLVTPFKGNYALGLSVDEKDGATTISHGGGIEVFNTWLGYDPDRKITVAVLSNINWQGADALGKSLMTLARGGEVTLTNERTEVALPVELLRSYEGTYEIGPTFGFTVKLEGDHLTVQATNQPAFPIFAEKEDEFFLKVTDAQLTFTRDASGAVDGAILHQGGRDAPAKRVTP